MGTTTTGVRCHDLGSRDFHSSVEQSFKLFRKFQIEMHLSSPSDNTRAIDILYHHNPISCNSLQLSKSSL